MVTPVQTPDDFEQAALQTPNIARIEEENYDSHADIIQYRVYLASDTAQAVQNESYSPVEALRTRLRGLGAETVELDTSSELIVLFPHE